MELVEEIEAGGKIQRQEVRVGVVEDDEGPGLGPLGLLGADTE